MKKLNNPDFLQLIRQAPLVAIDFVLREPGGQFLMGKRLNAPARGFWFVQGGRIFKDESLAVAQKRIAIGELGLEPRGDQIRFLGVAEHFYDDNFFEKEGIGTHYIVLVYAWELPHRPGIEGGQHTRYRWMDKEEILGDREVHENAKDYFRKYYNS